MILLAFLALVALALAGVIAVGWKAAASALRPDPPNYPWTAGDFPELTFEPANVLTRDGVTLAGRFFPGAGHATIVLSHGYGDTQDQMLPWAAFLHHAGFCVFTYDMRQRGASGGRFVTLGAKEHEDLIAVVDYLTDRPDVDAGRIGALGVSLGASTTIMAAADDTRIKAVVDDCGFSDAPSIIAASFERFVHLPAFPFAPVTVAVAARRAGVSVHDVRPVDVVGRISPRPLLIIHGTEDVLVPPENSERIFAAAGQPKEIWWVSGAGHAESFDVARDEYCRRVIAFFVAALGRTCEPE